MKIIAPLFLLAFASRAAAQELPKATLDKMKAGTVYVKAKLKFGEGTGSGFLFKKFGTVAYVITCDHVVSGASAVTVVFGSGSAAEKTFEAQVLAADPSRDLACLALKDAKDLPAVIEIADKTTVQETDTVYVCGFPFGAALAGDKKNPDIAVSKVSVSSLRRDAAGDLENVQLGGDVNPGNSGGPCIDAKGKVVGVIKSGIRGSSTSFAVPPEQIQAFLKGRVKGVSFAILASSAKSAKYEVTLQLVDPLGTLKESGFCYVRAEDLTEEVNPDKNGRWPKAKGMKDVAAKRKDDATVGTFEIARGPKDPDTVSLVFQCKYVQADGSTFYTQPDTLKVVFSEAAAPPVTTPGFDNTPRGSDLTTADAFAEARRLKLGAAVVDLFLSPEGDVLYALDLSEGLAYKIDAATLKITGQAEVPPNSVAMTLTPNGSTLYVVSRVPSGAYGAKARGTIQGISTKDMKATCSIGADVNFTGVQATDKGLLFLATDASSDGVVVGDASKKIINELVEGVRGRPIVRMTPDQSRVYVGGVDGYSFSCIPLPKDPKLGYVLNHSPSVSEQYQGDFSISPDGRFLFAAGGIVLRLSKIKNADMTSGGKIDPFVSLAAASGCNTFFVSTATGFVKQYALDSLELQKSVKVDVCLPYMALDAKKGILYTVCCPPSKTAGNSRWRRIAMLGDIVAYDVKGK